MFVIFFSYSNNGKNYRSRYVARTKQPAASERKIVGGDHQQHRIGNGGTSGGSGVVVVQQPSRQQHHKVQHQRAGGVQEKSRQNAHRLAASNAHYAGHGHERSRMPVSEIENE